MDLSLPRRSGTAWGLLEGMLDSNNPRSDLITPVADRLGHYKRYAIDPTRITDELGWIP